MTRINVGIKPKELTDKHLLAEHREIKRIPNMVRTGRAVIKDLPETFKLGKGHVKFFYNKLGYLLERYKKIYQECLDRDFNVTDFSDAWSGVSDELMGAYNPTERDRKLLQERIKSKLS